MPGGDARGNQPDAWRRVARRHPRRGRSGRLKTHRAGGLGELAPWSRCWSTVPGSPLKRRRERAIAGPPAALLARARGRRWRAGPPAGRGARGAVDPIDRPALSRRALVPRTAGPATGRMPSSPPVREGCTTVNWLDRRAAAGSTGTRAPRRATVRSRRRSSRRGARDRPAVVGGTGRQCTGPANDRHGRRRRRTRRPRPPCHTIRPRFDELRRPEPSSPRLEHSTSIRRSPGRSGRSLALQCRHGCAVP
jgi:hypothetical protein